jgi:hypothetical protein
MRLVSISAFIPETMIASVHWPSERRRKKELAMKKLITLAAIAALVAISAPSFAQSYDPSVGSGNIVPGPKGGMQSGTSAPPLYNYAPLSGVHHRVRPSARVR